MVRCPVVRWSRVSARPHPDALAWHKQEVFDQFAVEAGGEWIVESESHPDSNGDAPSEVSLASSDSPSSALAKNVRRAILRWGAI